ncbi:M1 family metallopeptidase [Lacinutrix salivirga]
MKPFLFLFLLLLNFSVEAQQTEYVDYKTAKAEIFFGINNANEIIGLMTFELDILKDTDSIFIDAKNFEKIAYRLNQSIQDSLYDGKHLIIKYSFKANTKHVLDVAWKTKPKKALYFVEEQIWTQGQGKYTSNWLPSIDDTNDKIEFDLSIFYDKNYAVLANGKLIDKEVGKTITRWHYDMQQPMSSYLVALAIGKYNKIEETSKSGIPLEFYYYPEDSTKVEPTYRYTKQMFDFLEEEIGVPYPWQNYKQVPVKDFLYSGMENTSLTIFSDDFMIDETSFIDKNYVNVNAHELAHQWFGDLVTAKSGEHHWLQEGFATYYALLAEQEVFGDDYHNWKLYEYAQELLQQDQAGQGTALLNPKSSSVTFYKKGAWVLHLLRDKVGDKAFKNAVKRYLNKHKFKNVDTNDFISEVEKTSREHLKEFVSKWLESDALHYNELIDNLKTHSAALQQKIKLDSALQSSSLDDYSINRYWEQATNDTVKIWFINENSNSLTEAVVKNALNSSNIKVRQAIAQNMNEVPSALKKEYERLLNDDSYVTKELALLNLWSSFPQERNKYLERTQKEDGFNDKNIRTLWLTLALVTPSFKEDNKINYYNELITYTSSNYNFRLRQNAFLYLANIDAFNKKALTNLVDATQHHNWRFKSFAKDLLKKLSENEKYKQLVEQILKDKNNTN